MTHIENNTPELVRNETDGNTEGLYISLAGMIGAGKTTLAHALGKYFKVPVYEEPVTANEYLEAFYADMKTNGAMFQIHLSTERYEQQQQIIWNKKGAIQDRSLYEDQLFAELLFDLGIMSEMHYKIYMKAYAQKCLTVRHPDIVVFIDVSAENSLKRIQKRGRDCEKGITLDYLTALHAKYQQFVERISNTVLVIQVPWDEFRKDDDIAFYIFTTYINNLKKFIKLDSGTSLPESSDASFSCTGSVNELQC